MTTKQIIERVESLNPLRVWDRIAFDMTKRAVEALESDLVTK